jgi:hypothetical protein
VGSECEGSEREGEVLATEGVGANRLRNKEAGIKAV